DTATLYDITPTILALAGLPPAGDMTGTSLLRRASTDTGPPPIASYEPREGSASAPQQAAQDQDTGADDELMRNLASLGYIGGSGPRPESPPAAAESPAPGTVTAHTNLAASLMQTGDLAGAEVELRRALEKRPGYFPALMTLSQVLVRSGRVAEALEAVRHAVSEAEDAEPGAYLHLALLAQRAGKVSETAAFLRGLPPSRSRKAGVETALGILAAPGDTVGAERHFANALSADPTSTEAMGRLFDLYRRQGREADLEPLVREAVHKDERSVMHHNWLGLILMRKGELQAAEAEFKNALELAPDFGGTMANLGSLYGRTGRLEEAVTILSRAVRIEPRNLEARVNLGASLAKRGEIDAAILSLEEARRAGMRSPELLNAIGLAYAQKGETLKAREALKESLSLLPRQPQVEALLADLSR
ncbi:MAG TPA: tetratricopeptide repeat protein, partial [Candidatus Polarisedimenticolia bacterium]|nr:tetratricopeptide repeat protein [Candidatus Polarisedimenticolia bacterium]